MIEVHGVLIRLGRIGATHVRAPVCRSTGRRITGSPPRRARRGPYSAST